MDRSTFVRIAWMAEKTTHNFTCAPSGAKDQNVRAKWKKSHCRSMIRNAVGFAIAICDCDCAGSGGGSPAVVLVHGWKTQKVFPSRSAEE